MAFRVFKPLLAVLMLAAAPAALVAQSVAQHESKARAGDAKAMVALGKAYEEGSGVAQNYADAARWYRAAADKGSAEGMQRLAAIYYEGKGVTKDFAEALKWNRAAAAKGNARAAWYIGMAYLSGNAVPKSDANAVFWYRKAAVKGDAEGLNSLGVMISLGKGARQSKVEALRYFERAADKGSRSALFNMAQLYKGVDGVPANLIAHDGLNAAWDRNADPKEWRVYMTQAQPLKPAGPAPGRAAPTRTGRYPWIVNQGSTTVTLYQNGEQICVMAPDENCGEVHVINELAAEFRAVSSSGGEARLSRQYGRDVPIHICVRDGPEIIGC